MHNLFDTLLNINFFFNFNEFSGSCAPIIDNLHSPLGNPCEIRQRTSNLREHGIMVIYIGFGPSEDRGGTEGESIYGPS